MSRPSPPPDSPEPAAPGSAFPVTRWSLVLSAARPDSPESHRALSELCELYWFPLYCYVRRRGHSPEDAEDLTQEFFRRILERDYFAAVDGARGRLRSYLLGSMKHFLADDADRRRALKRGGGRPVLSLDQESAEMRYAEAAVDALSPEVLFERRWAEAVMDDVLEALRLEQATAGREPVFAALRPFILGRGAAGSDDYTAVADRLGLTANAVRVSVFRLRKRFGHLMRAHIAGTVATPEEVEGEMRHLVTVLTGGAA